MSALSPRRVAVPARTIRIPAKVREIFPCGCELLRPDGHWKKVCDPHWPTPLNVRAAKHGYGCQCGPCVSSVVG